MFLEKLVLFLVYRVLRLNNSKFWNYIAWNFYCDWSQNGEEWTKSEEWKAALIEERINPYIDKNSYVLEIGPGGGRWTESLAKRVKKLSVVDLSPKCIKICKKRFKGFSNIDYFVNNGISLECIKDGSIDFIWSFDVFVHIEAKDIVLYVKEIYRVLKKGGKGIIHHSMKKQRNTPGWRSDMNDKLFKKILEENGLTLIEQFDSWNDGRFDVDLGYLRDVLSYFKK